MQTSGFIQITPHIYEFAAPFYRGAVKIWLVREADGWVLIDTAAPGSHDIVLQAVETTAGGPPACIILTHGHMDHAGTLKELVRRWNVPAWAHRLEVPYISGPARYRDIRPAVWQYRLANRLINSRPPGVPIARALDQGDRIGSLEVIHAPGHAPGLIALLHAEDRAVIGGDTVANVRGKLRQPVAIFTYDPEEARRSIRKLLHYDFDHLLISHGQPILQTAKRQLETAF